MFLREHRVRPERSMDEESRNIFTGDEGDIAIGKTLILRGVTSGGSNIIPNPVYVNREQGDYGNPNNPIAPTQIDMTGLSQNVFDLTFNSTLSVYGNNFESVQGTGSVRVDEVEVEVESWSDSEIVIRLSASDFGLGNHTVTVYATNGAFSSYYDGLIIQDESTRNNFDGTVADIAIGKNLMLLGVISAGTLVVTGGDIPIPEKPIITNAVSYSSTVNKVKWNFVPLAEWYDLYKDGVKINTVAITGVEYIDEDVNADITYVYTVIASNRSGSSSASDPYTVVTLTDTSKTTAIKVNESITDEDSEITRT